MIFTEYSLLMAVLWSDVIILVVYLLRHCLWFIRLFSVKTVTILYAGCFLRLCCNMEFSTVQEISLPQMNFVNDLLSSTTIFNFSVKELFLLIWFIGGLLLITNMIVMQRKLRCRYIAGALKSKEAELYLNEIMEAKDKGKISVITCKYVKSPCIIGLRHGIICLPEYDWTRKKLRIILSHEYAHYKNGDLVIVLLVDIFAVVFWWNVPVYLLKNHLTEILEYKADETVLRDCKPSDARYYCKTLVEFAGAGSKSSSGFTSAIESRIRRILSEPPDNRIIYSGLFLFLVIGSFLLSYIFLPQPLYVPNGEAGAVYSIEQNGNGTIAIHINGTVYIIPAEEYERLLKKESQS